MKHFKLLLLSSIVLASCTNQTVQQTAYLEDSRKTVQAFHKSLGGQLKQQIKAGGIESAIPVCQKIAPATAAKFSTNDKIVKRVSTKARNTTQGTPDAWELAALKAFDEKIKYDPSEMALEKGEVVKEGGVKYYRYAKAIRIKPVCLNCHGAETDIRASVKKVLAKHYPNDVATGYKVGDLRGAFSVKQKIN
jgi:hypothetical protein